MQTSNQTGAGAARAIPNIADSDTPFVFNCWYIGALSTEIGRTLTRRRLLDQDVVFYRRLDGTPAALNNRCPHRSAPLSAGRLNGDTVTCGYHGFTFNDCGTCVRVPSQESVPKGLNIQAYPALERGPFIWIWMGDPARADPALMPAHDWLTDPAFAHIEGYFNVKCNYLALHENVLDLTHVPFLHGEHNATLQFAESEGDVMLGDGTVTISRSEYERVAPPHYAAAIGSGERKVDRHSVSHFLSPAFHAAETTVALRDAQAGERSEYKFEIIHAFTPETAGTTHYFWSNARDSSVDREDISELILERSTKVYYEDVEILEAAETIRANDRRPSFKADVSVRSDQPGIQIRRLVAKMAMAEAR